MLGRRIRTVYKDVLVGLAVLHSHFLLVDMLATTGVVFDFWIWVRGFWLGMVW